MAQKFVYLVYVKQRNKEGSHMKELWMEYMESLEDDQKATDEGFVDYLSGLTDISSDRFK